MKFKDAIKQLEEYGTAQNRKVYPRHGVKGEMFGVSFGNLNKMKKQIKKDHELALALWDTGNFDARNLATMIVDEDQVDSRFLEQWVAELDNYVLTDSFAAMVARTPFALDKMKVWVQTNHEWVSRAGWRLLSYLAMEESDLEDSFFEFYITDIVEDIHNVKNRTRDGMYNALIAIGGRNTVLKEKAIIAAGKIGKIEVDHGETNCKTPDAVEYINKIWERKKKK